MSMGVTLENREPILYQYEGEIEIDGEKYPFQVSWNFKVEEVVSIDWETIPSKKLMKAEKRIVQLVTHVVKENAKFIIV
jgi:hypothetical protein